jgi:hypothetical protein
MVTNSPFILLSVEPFAGGGEFRDRALGKIIRGKTMILPAMILPPSVFPSGGGAAESCVPWFQGFLIVAARLSTLGPLWIRAEALTVRR